MEFSTTELVSRLAKLFAANIRYEMSGMVGKVRPITRDPADIGQLDCSGFVEYVIYHTTTNRHDIPAGSRRQWSWFRDNGYAEVDYPTFAPRNDDVVRIGFRAAEHGRNDEGERVRTKAGHVWLVINGSTYESTTRGRNNGVSSLNWDARTDQADAFYTLGSASGFMILRYLSKHLMPAQFLS